MRGLGLALETLSLPRLRHIQQSFALGKQHIDYSVKKDDPLPQPTAADGLRLQLPSPSCFPLTCILHMTLEGCIRSLALNQKLTVASLFILSFRYITPPSLSPPQLKERCSSACFLLPEGRKQRNTVFLAAAIPTPETNTLKISRSHLYAQPTAPMSSVS